jgi:Transglutaminase-like superfamily/Coenzyme PQQ synthesis protein D (PqqD)
VRRLRASRAIRHAEIDGCRVILDLNTETYRALDEVASAMWSVLTDESDRDSALESLAARFDVDRPRLEADLARFERTCVDEGLLEADAQSLAERQPLAEPLGPTRRASPEFARRRPPGLRAALTALHWTRRALARDGFRATYESCAALPPGRDPRRLPQALAAFVRAENLFVAGRAPNDCLVRSLALHRFLVSGDVPSQHVIGVTRFPFQAHAWVDSDGGPLLDSRARGLGFAPLARIG